MDFSLISFITVSHFWQFLFLCGFIGTTIIFGIFYLWFSKYPDMVFDKLGLIKYAGMVINSTGNGNEHIERGVNTIERTEEFYDGVMSKFYSKSFFPILFFFAFNSFFAYILYGFASTFSMIEGSSIIFNIILFISSFIITKRLFFKK